MFQRRVLLHSVSAQFDDSIHLGRCFDTVGVLAHIVVKGKMFLEDLQTNVRIFHLLAFCLSSSSFEDTGLEFVDRTFHVKTSLRYRFSNVKTACDVAFPSEIVDLNLGSRFHSGSGRDE